MAKVAFKKKTLFTSKLDLDLRKKLVKCYIWSMALCGAETWTVWKVDQECLESFGNVLLEKNGEARLERSCVK